MISCVDHIDMRVKDLETTVELLSKVGLEVVRRTPAPRSSVEMRLPGPGQVTFEIRPSDGTFEGVHHVAFRQTEADDVERLKELGVVFKTEHMMIKDTGRTVSTFSDANGQTWQLTD